MVGYSNGIWRRGDLHSLQFDCGTSWQHRYREVTALRLADLCCCRSGGSDSRDLVRDQIRRSRDHEGPRGRAHNRWMQVDRGVLKIQNLSP